MTDTLGADVFPASIKDADSDSFIPGLRIKAIGSDMPLGSAPLIHDFHREAEYFDLAKDAQGTALPRFIGLFETDTATFLIFEDYGRTLTNKERISEDVQYVPSSFEGSSLFWLTGVARKRRKQSASWPLRVLPPLSRRTQTSSEAVMVF